MIIKYNAENIKIQQNQGITGISRPRQDALHQLPKLRVASSILVTRSNEIKMKGFAQRQTLFTMYYTNITFRPGLLKNREDSIMSLPIKEYQKSFPPGDTL